MTAPVRLQLSRRAGFNLQRLSLETNGLPAVVVARPGRFGNPFTIKGARGVGYSGTDDELAGICVHDFRVWLTGRPSQSNWVGPESYAAKKALMDGLPELRGKNLACWCPPGRSCHADVLIELAGRQ